MKVRLLNLVALVAVAMCAQAVSQEPAKTTQEQDSLERALADLNNGLVPSSVQNGGVLTGESTSLTIGGDFRIRNTSLNASAPLINSFAAGATTGRTDWKNVDARARLNFDFKVNQDVNAFIGLNVNENFGSQVGGAGAAVNNIGASGPNIATVEPFNGNTGSVNQYYVDIRDVFLEGEEWTFGRQNYTLGSGRILGTDQWDQRPNTYTGVWYTYPLETIELEVFWIGETGTLGNSSFSAFGTSPQLAGTRTSANIGGGNADVDVFGITTSYAMEDLEFFDNLDIQPYLLRQTVGGISDASRNWIGFQVTGRAAEFLNFDVEATWMDDPSDDISGVQTWGGDANAVAIEFGFELSELFDGAADYSPVLDFGYLAGDQGGDITINPSYHNQAGLFDYTAKIGGLTGAASRGVWNGTVNTWYVGLEAEPVDGWMGRIAYLTFNDSNAARALPAPVGLVGDAFDASEIDVTVSHTFDPGLEVMAGWAWLNHDPTVVGLTADNSYIVYLVGSVSF